MNKEELFGNIQKKKSYLCIGLDTDMNKLPKIILDTGYPVYEFNKRIIDFTSEYAVAYKPNLAFYETLGAAGWISLELTVTHIRRNYPDILVIADAKRSDIGNSSKMYAKAFFERLDVDAVTVNPYMGEDSVRPFLEHGGKWAVVLGLTSNPGSEDLQMAREKDSGEPVFAYMMKKTRAWGTADNMMYVVGATRPDLFKKVREICPDHFLLVPGIGAQGGSLHQVSEQLMNKQCGIIVNVSRSVIYASVTNQFAEEAREKAMEIQASMEKLLTGKKLI